MNDSEQSTGGVKAVETSMQVLDALREMSGGSVAEIVERTDLSRGAVYKHLNTLSKHDYVAKADGDYNLGFRFLDHGGWLRSRYAGSELVRPQIRELADATNEVALFSIDEANKSVTLFREDGTRGVYTRARLGQRFPLNQTAAGKAILSRMPTSEVEQLVERVGLPGATDRTITDETTFFDELETIRDCGYAVNNEESTDGVVAIAVPLAPADTVIGACSIAGPKHRMTDERLSGELAPLLESIVTELELNIAHSHGPVTKFCPQM